MNDSAWYNNRSSDACRTLFGGLLVPAGLCTFLFLPCLPALLAAPPCWHSLMAATSACGQSHPCRTRHACTSSAAPAHLTIFSSHVCCAVAIHNIVPAPVFMLKQLQTHQVSKSHGAVSAAGSEPPASGTALHSCAYILCCLLEALDCCFCTAKRALVASLANRGDTGGGRGGGGLLHDYARTAWPLRIPTRNSKRDSRFLHQGGL